MRLQRSAQGHETLRAQAGVRSEDYWDFRPRQRVMTVDGYPGRVTAVHDGPHPGNEAYEVVLDGGMGGGMYASGQLRALAEEERTAANDYPELEDILARRPDPARQVVTAKRATTQNGTKIDDHGEAPHEVRAQDPNGYDERSTEGDVDPHMIEPLSERDEQGAKGGELAKVPSGVRYEGMLVPGDWSNPLIREAVAEMHCFVGHRGPCPSPPHEAVLHEGMPSTRHEEPYGFDYRTEENRGGKSESLDKKAATHVLHGYINGKHVGDLHYTPSDDRNAVKVNMLHSWDRGQGAASAMTDALYHEHPGAYINHGWRTPDGIDWARQYESPDPDRDVHQAHPEDGPHGGWMRYFNPHKVAFDMLENHDSDDEPELGRHPEPQFNPDDYDNPGTEKVGPHWSEHRQKAEQVGWTEEPWTSPAELGWQPSRQKVSHLNHEPTPEHDADLFDHLTNAHGYAPHEAMDLAQPHGLRFVHEQNHGPTAHFGEEDLAIPHHHPELWYERPTVPAPAAVENGQTGGHSGDMFYTAPLEGDRWERWKNFVSQNSLADPYALVAQAATDPDLRFHFTATWADVRAKAKRIRGEGHVRITLATEGMVIGEVQGDHATYESGVQRLPGSRQAVAAWSCGCRWGAYHWGAPDDNSRYAGRMCSHVYALQLEAQSRGMFGRTVEVDSQKPGWTPDRIVVKHDIDSGQDIFARASATTQYGSNRQAAPSLSIPALPESTPLDAFVRFALADGESLGDVVLLLRAAGLITEGATSSPFGERAVDVEPKPYGATQPPNKWENPASAGFLATPDPDGWGALDPTGSMPMTAVIATGDEARDWDLSPEERERLWPHLTANTSGIYEDPDSPADPQGLEASLHDETEAALPETDGELDMSDPEALSPEDPSIQTIGNQIGGDDEILDEATGPGEDTSDVVARFQASAAAQSLMSSGGSSGAGHADADIAARARQVVALKAFTPGEQRMLIDEAPGRQASNVDRLDIAGTHYADLDSEDDETWLA